MASGGKSNRIYVGGLPDHVVKEQLEKEFERFGRLTDVWMAYNPPGFSFIEFETDESAQSAVQQMNGIMFQGSRLRVEVSKGRSKGRGGGGGGGSRGGSRGGRSFGARRSFEPPHSFGHRPEHRYSAHPGPYRRPSPPGRTLTMIQTSYDDYPTSSSSYGNGVGHQDRPSYPDRYADPYSSNIYADSKASYSYPYRSRSPVDPGRSPSIPMHSYSMAGQVPRDYVVPSVTPTYETQGYAHSYSSNMYPPRQSPPPPGMYPRY